MAISLPLVCPGRLIENISPSELFTDSKLIFVGKVESVKESRFKTGLSYPFYENVTFRWLAVDLMVVEPFKGVQKGQRIHAAMLSVDKRSRSQPSYSPPGMLNPSVGDVFFLCLAPTPESNLYAALRAPYDEDYSVFVLHRDNQGSADQARLALSSTSGPSPTDSPAYGLIWSLADGQGGIVPASAEKFSQAFAKELATPAPTNMIVYLEWETRINQGGWRMDVPKVTLGTSVEEYCERLWYLILPAAILPVLDLFYRKRGASRKP